MARSLLGGYGYSSGGSQPGWLGDPQEFDTARLRASKEALEREIARLKAQTDLGDFVTAGVASGDADTSPAGTPKAEAAPDIGSYVVATTADQEARVPASAGVS